jgi:hypothetical protein
MNCVFRDQHIVGFESLLIGRATVSYGQVAKSSVIGVAPISQLVAGMAYTTTHTTQFHKGRSTIVR